MIAEKLIVYVGLGTVLVYYVTLILHLIGVIKLTNDKLLTWKIFIPFNMWRKKRRNIL